MFAALLAGLILGAAAAPDASAQSYPVRPVRLVVTHPPGGATDILGRLVSERLGLRLGQQVIVENKPGAGGNIAASFVAKAAADGYTLLTANHPGFTTAPTLAKNPGFDSVKDFTAVALLATQTMLLTAHPSLPVNTVAELVAYAKARPGRLSYASPGMGTPHHLAMEMFKQMAGVDLVHIPYKGGAPAMQDVVAGQVPVMFGSFVIAGPHLQAGKLKALGASGASRNTQKPDVPTIAEQGYPGFDVVNWFGFVAPSGTPPAVVARLNRDIIAVLAIPELKQQILRIGFDLAPAMSPAEFANLIRTDVANWSKVIRDAKLAPE